MLLTVTFPWINVGSIFCRIPVMWRHPSHKRLLAGSSWMTTQEVKKHDNRLRLLQAGTVDTTWQVKKPKLPPTSFRVQELFFAKKNRRKRARFKTLPIIPAIVSTSWTRHFNSIRSALRITKCKNMFRRICLFHFWLTDYERFILGIYPVLTLLPVHRFVWNAPLLPNKAPCHVQIDSAPFPALKLFSVKPVSSQAQKALYWAFEFKHYRPWAFMRRR